ncbi:hypothetical protein ACKAWT_13330 [Xanthomonas vasicola]|uniref:hypothetical protein n=1 Tax=Xanthomonas vasicola TaxID=56459 RepID=UPI00149450C3|nr:hypothetical protein [Xanthomonas vasicola]MDO6940578.1 hypothetical protein [Xanthomonas vasicola]MDO6956543.1 hypothetical protein [Xanthomonas vasicola]MDO6973623.1 hypothetical protein [Xanthomonas vasicola]
MAVFAIPANPRGLFLLDDARFAFFGKDASPEKISFEPFAPPIVWAEVVALLLD